MTDESDIREPQEGLPPSEVETQETPAERPYELKWYVVHTFSGYENRAKLLLEDRIRTFHHEDKFGQILVPTETVAEVVGGKKRTSQRKFFPGYILVEMHVDEETWHLLKDTEKITGFVGGARNPRPMKDAEVRRITQQMEEGEKEAKPVHSFEEGQSVRVIEGPFVNFAGTIDEVKAEKRKLRVLVTIFGRSTPVEVDFMQVEKV
ncbi:MAG: transcription termination/antitermination protein NusG [Pseudomonadota bacterium]